MRDELGMHLVAKGNGRVALLNVRKAACSFGDQAESLIQEMHKAGAEQAF
jgi:hypothetical protein